ncbi:hypothetical protein AB0N05_16925 [Nocardia sp. NPDC051030]|uniref:hypothetical protein n=1 Tax=Nocardia sp. NPDC051030 TaxID=3155162 RepID=UPI00343FEDCE
MAPKGSEYRGWLGAEVRQDLAAKDFVRELDPCGFVNDAAIATLGTPTYFGRDQGFDECLLIFRPAVGPNQLSRIKVTTEFRGSSSPKVDLGGTSVGVKAEGGYCIADVPFRNRVISFWTDSLNGSDTCSEAKKFVTAALPQFRTTPLRSESKIALNNTPLARMDPCAALSIVGKNRPRLKVQTGVVPYYCGFMLDSDDQSTAQNLTSTQKTLDMVEYAVKKNETMQVGSARARISSSKPAYCSLDLYLDEKSPRVTTYNSGDPERWVDVVEMSGQTTCEELAKTATAIVELYNSQ